MFQTEVNPTSYSLTVQDGFSPLCIASEYGHSDVVDILLKAGADVHQATTKVWYRASQLICPPTMVAVV